MRDWFEAWVGNASGSYTKGSWRIPRAFLATIGFLWSLETLGVTELGLGPDQKTFASEVDIGSTQ